MRHARPVWAEISIDRLLHNYHLLREAARDAGLIAVVKANAYGHGALACASALEAAGVEWLGVTCVEEGIAVRSVCRVARILVMSGIWESGAEAALAHRLTPVVWETAHLEWLEAAAHAQQWPHHSIPVHLEIDTGMSRQGVQPHELSVFLDRIEQAQHIAIEGVMTHFHSPEVLSDDATAEQIHRFDAALAIITARGFHPSMIHAGNSATNFSDAASVTKLAAKYGAKAMLRPGLALYGYAPRFSEKPALPAIEALQPVLSWKTRVISLRSVAPGESAGYCATFHAQQQSHLALLPVGYADGLNRLLSNRGYVLVHGERVPIAGRISMDLTIVDVTDIPGVKLGDEVVLIGEQQKAGIRDQGLGIRDSITAYDLADIAGTIPYEVLCAISARVPRVTIGGDARA